MAPRIAIAGFQHETNSFGIGQAGLHEFEMPDSWPGLLTGSEVISETQGLNLPLAGFVDAARTADAELLPILWCAAEPSGPVTDAAFEAISSRIVDGLSNAAPLDGIYLDLHGAMITESYDNGESALLSRIRAEVGPLVPIVISLDMHANISDSVVEQTDVICVFKTYPHLDMAQTGARCWTRLKPLLEGKRPAKAFRRLGALVPLHAQTTDTEPAQTLYRSLPDDPDAHVELALGFTASDAAEIGPSLVAFAETQGEANEYADKALDQLRAAQNAFKSELMTPEDAVSCALAAPIGKPVVLADVQDNPGAGSSSDTTGVLRALINGKAQRALLGLMHDPAMVIQAQVAGVGAVINGALGGKSGIEEDDPLEGRFQVVTLDKGDVPYTGAMYGGGIATLGPSCALRVIDTDADVTVVVTSTRNQCLDLAQFRHFGLQPEEARIIAVKSTAHFRADFGPIASKVIPVASPGLFPCKPPFKLSANLVKDLV